MSKTIYLISGLGADSRVFRKLDFSGRNIRHVEWIQPVKGETISSYARRLLPQISQEKPLIIGLSFGGLVAIEISKIIETEQVILIASAKNKYELPIYYRLLGKLNIHRVVPTFLLKRSNWITNWIFGVSEQEHKHLLKVILSETDSKFLRWAIDQAVKWSNVEVQNNVVHIHGEKDRIIPLRNIRADFSVPNAGHFMTLNKAKEVNLILSEVLKGPNEE